MRLRRAALGIIRLIVENSSAPAARRRVPCRGRRLSLADGQGRTNAAKDDVVAELLAFIADRLKVHLRGEGVRHDLIDAVFAESGGGRPRAVCLAKV